MQRLEVVAPELARLVYSANPRSLRELAISVSRLAVERTRLEDPAAIAALRALEEGRFADSRERRAVEALANKLDLMQGKLRDRVNAGEIELKSEQLSTFRQARATLALFFALDPDSLIAAVESMYEAHAAVQDLPLLQKVVLSVVSAP
jgi:hypothetical protein